MTTRRRVGAVLLAAVLLATTSGTAGCGSGIPHTTLTTTPVPTPAEGCISDDEQRLGAVALDTGNGATAQGLVLGAGGTGIVFANQSDETLCAWKSWAGPLVSKGYSVLVFDYSGRPADKDVLAGLDALRRRGVQKVFLVGASMGGNAVLAAAPQAQPPVAGVVGLSAPQVYRGVDAIGAMPRLTVPVFFTAARDDTPFGTDAQALYDACASTDKKLDLEVGASHGMELLDDAMSTTIEKFLQSH
jgi:pimeloyl-ACP methyl ester carboxylesterase